MKYKECTFEIFDVKWVAEYEDYDGEIILHGIYLLDDRGNNNLIELLKDAVEEEAQREAEIDAADRRAGQAEQWEDR